MTQLPGLASRRLWAAAAVVIASLGAGIWAPGPAWAQGREPYVRAARMLPLELRAPAAGRVGQPLPGLSVRLQNPGDEVSDARLRIFIHDKQHGEAHRELNPDNVKVEVLERGGWSPVLLEIVDGGVMGAVGEEGAAEHRERHRRGGFAIRAGFDRRWPFRVTFGQPGTYTVVVAVSPDNGSRHLAQPTFAHIEVR